MTYLWLQGTISAFDELDERLLRRKMTGQMVLCAFGILAAIGAKATALPGVTGALVVAVVTLALGYLLLLFLVRDEEMRERQRELGLVVGNGAIRPWIAVSIMSMVGVTLLVTAFMQSEGLREAISQLPVWISRAYDFGFAVASLILLRWHQMLYWLAIIAYSFGWGACVATWRRTCGMCGMAGALGERMDPASLLPYFAALIYIAAGLAIAYLLHRMTSRAATRAYSEGGEEERHSLGVWNSLLADIANMPRREPGAAALAGEEVWEPSHPRAIYARLMRWGKAQGRPRRSAETEAAYEGALVQELQAPLDRSP